MLLPYLFDMAISDKYNLAYEVSRKESNYGEETKKSCYSEVAGQFTQVL